jgi:hypothetical protein
MMALHDDLKPLSELICCLARDAVNIQILWDEVHKNDGERFATLLSTLQPELREALAVLTPARLIVDEFRVTAGVRIGLEQKRGFEIRAVPINAGFSIRCGLKADTQSSICVSVEQVPMCTGSAKKSP